MHIRVFGPGCARCKQTEKIVRLAIQELQLDATVEKISNVEEFAKFGITATPTVMIDNIIVLSGQVPKIQDIKDIIASL